MGQIYMTYPKGSYIMGWYYIIVGPQVIFMF